MRAAIMLSAWYWVELHRAGLELSRPNSNPHDRLRDGEDVTSERVEGQWVYISTDGDSHELELTFRKSKEYRASDRAIINNRS